MRGFRPFWLEQALASEKAAPAPPLAGPVRADVCIVGGGYTGLWTALQIKRQAPAKEVVLLESDICGAGASGRNGGCVLSWATKFKTLCRLFGLDEAARLVRASEQAIDEIGAFVREHRIDCDFRHEGVLYTAIANAHVGSTDAVIADLAAHGLNSYMTLPVDEARRRSGTVRTLAGVYSSRGATVQPARLVRGLRRVAMEMGVRIYENSPVVAIEAGVKPRVRVARGAVETDKLVLAVNAWMPELFKEFERTIVVVSSDMVVTEPRPELLAQTGLAAGLAVLDSRTFVYYYHSTEDGRIMLGKGGNTFAYRARMLPVFDQPSPYRDSLAQALGEFFPPYAAVPVVASWNGPSDRSTSGLPFFGRLRGHHSIFYGLGYSGNGVGPSYMGGQILSSLALGQDNAWTMSGIVRGSRGHFPPEPFRYAGSLLVRGAIRRKEQAEDAGRVPARLDRALARLADAAGKADHD